MIDVQFLHKRAAIFLHSFYYCLRCTKQNYQLSCLLSLYLSSQVLPLPLMAITSYSTGFLSLKPSSKRVKGSLPGQNYLPECVRGKHLREINIPHSNRCPCLMLEEIFFYNCLCHGIHYTLQQYYPFWFCLYVQQSLEDTTNLNTLLLKNFTDNFKRNTGQCCKRKILVLINWQVCYCCNYFH